MILREMIITCLCLLSVVGGTAATTEAISGGKLAPPTPLAAITPDEASAWVAVIVNSLPALVAALMLAWGNYRETRRRLDADDAQPGPEVIRLRAENARLAALLDDAESAAKQSGPASFPVEVALDDLPRWEPQVTLDDRDLEPDDETDFERTYDNYPDDDDRPQVSYR